MRCVASAWARRLAMAVLWLGCASVNDASAQSLATDGALGLRHASVTTPSPQCPARDTRSDEMLLRSYGDADYRWSLESLAGDTLTLARFRGKVMFINVWATWCPPCIAELESIERLAASLRESADSSIAMLLVTPERRATVAPFARRRALATPVYLERKRTPAAWRLFGLPTTYIVAPDGRIVLSHRGATRWDTDQVRDFLRVLACR